MIPKEVFLYKVKTEVFPKFIQTEKYRFRALLKGAIIIFIAFALLGGFIIVFRHDIMRDPDILKITAFVFPVFFLGIDMWEKFKIKQKKKLSPIFLDFLGNLTTDEKNFNLKLVRYSCLLGEFDGCECDDCISGSFENTRFSLAELKLSRGVGKESRCIFRGICIDIPMSTHISGYVLLFNSKFHRKKIALQRLSLEDRSFSKNYQIFADNQIEARVLLTPAFMDRLNNLKKYFKNKRIDVSFFGNHAVFAIHTRKDFFEPYSIFRKITNIKIYEKYYDEIRSIFDLTEILGVDSTIIKDDLSFNEKIYRKISSEEREFYRKRSNLLLFLSIFTVVVLWIILVLYLWFF